MNRNTDVLQGNRKVKAIVIPAFISWIFTLLGVIILKEYGWGIFIFIPLFIGTCATVIYGYRQKEKLKKYFFVSTTSLFVYCAGLLVFAIEGLICLVMAAPLGILISMIGVGIGHVILDYYNKWATTIIPWAVIAIPIILGFESIQENEPRIFSTTSSVIIDRPPSVVWQQVIAFTHIGEPKEWFFKAGIAYPTHAEIKTVGNKKIRYCNFSTGCFVEPITNWQEPSLLQFSVEKTPMPLKEISPYDIEPAHLHGYFISEKGEFRLTALPGGKTLLEGTTWYHHKIKPEFYWKLWSDYMIHKIHSRVLNHIKSETENIYASSGNR